MYTQGELSSLSLIFSNFDLQKWPLNTAWFLAPSKQELLRPIYSGERTGPLYNCNTQQVPQSWVDGKKRKNCHSS